MTRWATSDQTQTQNLTPGLPGLIGHRKLNADARPFARARHSQREPREPELRIHSVRSHGLDNPAEHAYVPRSSF